MAPTSLCSRLGGNNTEPENKASVGVGIIYTEYLLSRAEMTWSPSFMRYVMLLSCAAAGVTSTLTDGCRTNELRFVSSN